MRFDRSIGPFTDILLPWIFPNLPPAQTLSNVHSPYGRFSRFILILIDIGLSCVLSARALSSSANTRTNCPFLCHSRPPIPYILVRPSCQINYRFLHIIVLAPFGSCTRSSTWPSRRWCPDSAVIHAGTETKYPAVTISK